MARRTATAHVKRDVCGGTSSRCRCGRLATTSFSYPGRAMAFLRRVLASSKSLHRLLSNTSVCPLPIPRAFTPSEARIWAIGQHPIAEKPWDGRRRTIGSPFHLQMRHVYVEVFDNDLDSALKVYKRKMRDAKVDEKIREKRYYSKPSERRKLAKHYKKLNRARRELGEKIKVVKHRMEKIREVRKINREEKRAKGAEET